MRANVREPLQCVTDEWGNRLRVHATMEIDSNQRILIVDNFTTTAPMDYHIRQNIVDAVERLEKLTQELKQRIK